MGSDIINIQVGGYPDWHVSKSNIESYEIMKLPEAYNLLKLLIRTKSGRDKVYSWPLMCDNKPNVEGREAAEAIIEFLNKELEV